MFYEGSQENDLPLRHNIIQKQGQFGLKTEMLCAAIT